MDSLGYLLTGSIAILTAGGLNLAQVTRLAPEGYQDVFGFHFGLSPKLSTYSGIAGTPFTPANQARASLPKTPKRRQSRGSKPPMLPAELSVEDLKPSAPDKSKSNDSQRSRDLKAGQTQIPFPQAGASDDLN